MSFFRRVDEGDRPFIREERKKACREAGSFVVGTVAWTGDRALGCGSGEQEHRPLQPLRLIEKN